MTRTSGRERETGRVAFTPAPGGCGWGRRWPCVDTAPQTRYARPRREVVVPLAAIGVKAVLQPGEGDRGAVDVEHLAAEARLHRVPAHAGWAEVSRPPGACEREDLSVGAAAHIDGPGRVDAEPRLQVGGEREMYWVISPPYPLRRAEAVGARRVAVGERLRAEHRQRAHRDRVVRGVRQLRVRRLGVVRKRRRVVEGRRPAVRARERRRRGPERGRRRPPQ